MEQPPETQAPDGQDFDVIVVGAGISGIYQLHKLRGSGLRVRVFEAGGGVGGVWYWNRYPGARLDTESYLYTLVFPQAEVGDWRWSEHFAGQPELERYLNFVVDRLDLRRHIEFDATVASAWFDEERAGWKVTLRDGRVFFSRFFVPAVGPLSEAVLPKLAGIAHFRGEVIHTARWPQDPVRFEGRNIGVVGTAASGVQTIQEVSKTCKSLVVFQRTANWCTPLNNSPIDDMDAIRARETQMWQRSRQSENWSFHNPDPRKTFEVEDAERRAFFAELYASPGLRVSHGNFSDVFLDPEANAEIGAFVHEQIARRVQDPETARKLQPTTHGFGTKRIPLESGYFEVFNQPHVTLVDLREEPITDFTATEAVTTDRRFALDMLICATGFDAITGAFDRIDIRGRGGKRLVEYWRDGPRTLLGIMTDGFPNMFMPAGPLTALGNVSHAAAYTIDWAFDLMRHMRDHGHRTAEPTQAAVDAWMDHVSETSGAALANEVDSWMTGVNKNLDNKTNRYIGLYRGGARTYRAHCERVAQNGYAGIRFDADPGPRRIPAGADRATG